MLKKTEDERKLMAKYSQEIVKVMKGEKPKFRVFKEFDYELDTMRRMKKVKKTNEEFPLKVEVLCKHFINLLSPAILESAVNEQIEEFKHKEDKEMLEELWSQLKEIL
jgi:anaerobic ribonucleoside-triphosphate reductase